MYLDTPILAKLFFAEPESNEVQRIASAQGALHSSEILLTEFHSVVARKRREQGLPEEMVAEIIAAFEQQIEEGVIQLVPLTREQLMASGRLMLRLRDTLGLRSLDAIHLHACMEYSLHPLFTNDRVMLAAAAALGIPTQPLRRARR
jgi:predicted nucleic acid-binding protein